MPSDAMTNPQNSTAAGATPFAVWPDSGPTARQPPSPPASHKGEWFSPEHHPAPDPAQLGDRREVRHPGEGSVIEINSKSGSLYKDA